MRDSESKHKQANADTSGFRGTELRALVCLLARQAARDWFARFSHPVDQTNHEEKIHDQA